MSCVFWVAHVVGTTLFFLQDVSLSEWRGKLNFHAVTATTPRRGLTEGCAMHEFVFVRAHATLLSNKARNCRKIVRGFDSRAGKRTRQNTPETNLKVLSCGYYLRRPC